MTLRKTLALFVSSLSLAACGGGGGDGGSVSAGGTGGGGSGGGASNSAPVVSISVSENSPNEGLTSTLDASGSSDADGDTLTFSWAQLSGPDVTFSATNSAETTITVPNLTTDASARLQVSVSDGTVTSTNEVTLTLTNVVQSPMIDDSAFYKLSKSIAQNAVDIFQYYSAFSFESEMMIAFNDETEITLSRVFFDYESDFDVSAPLETTGPSSATAFGLGYPEIHFGRSFGFMESDKIRFLDTDNLPPLLEIQVENPCGFHGTEYFANGVTDGKRLIIGKPGSGAELHQLVRTNEVLESSRLLTSFGETRTICHLKQYQDGRLLAFDEDANELVYYAPVFDGDQLVDYSETGTASVNLMLNTGESAEFVTAEVVGDRFSHAGLALVFSDGNTEGVHRLVMAGIDNSGQLIQDTQTWPYGSPVDVAVVNFDRSGHRNKNIMVVASDSPHAIVFNFENQIPVTNQRFLDVGVGAEAVMQYFALSVAPRIGGPLMLYPNSNELKFIGVRED